MLQFSHHDLQLLNPSFDSPLVYVLSELEFLRRLRLEGDTPQQTKFTFITLPRPSTDYLPTHFRDFSHSKQPCF